MGQALRKRTPRSALWKCSSTLDTGGGNSVPWALLSWMSLEKALGIFFIVPAPIWRFFPPCLSGIPSQSRQWDMQWERSRDWYLTPWDTEAWLSSVVLPSALPGEGNLSVFCYTLFSFADLCFVWRDSVPDGLSAGEASWHAATEVGWHEQQHQVR